MRKSTQPTIAIMTLAATCLAAMAAPAGATGIVGGPATDGVDRVEPQASSGTGRDVVSAKPSAAGKSTVGSTSVQPGASDAIPESATWAIMIIGFGVVGSVLRRRIASRSAPTG